MIRMEATLWFTQDTQMLIAPAYVWILVRPARHTLPRGTGEGHFAEATPNFYFCCSNRIQEIGFWFCFLSFIWIYGSGGWESYSGVVTLAEGLVLL